MTLGSRAQIRKHLHAKKVETRRTAGQRRLIARIAAVPAHKAAGAAAGLGEGRLVGVRRLAGVLPDVAGRLQAAVAGMRVGADEGARGLAGRALDPDLLRAPWD